MKKLDKTPLVTLVGATVLGSLSTGAVSAADNPFALKELTSGYAQLAEATQEKGASEMKCSAEMMKNNPEMKCGAEMMKPKEDKAAQQKAMEMKCAGMKMDTPPAQTPKTP